MTGFTEKYTFLCLGLMSGQSYGSMIGQKVVCSYRNKLEGNLARSIQVVLRVSVSSRIRIFFWTERGYLWNKFFLKRHENGLLGVDRGYTHESVGAQRK